MGIIQDLPDTCDLGRGYEGREFNYPYDNPGLGTMAVDWEERIDVKRMREERLAKAKEAVKDAGVGGIRLEDNVVVTDTGMDLISRFPYDNRLLR